jgi:large subunit ribosomal protein L4
MNVKVITLEGKPAGTKAALAAWDARRVSPQLLHQVAVGVLTNRRVSRAHTKDRAERRGGGRKPWKQKGTGRARHGSIRSPLWRKGGRAFGPRADRTYRTQTPASMRRSAFAGVLAGKIRDDEFFLLERLPATSGKTGELASAFQLLPVRGSALLLVAGTAHVREPFLRASRNLRRLRIADPASVNVADLLHFRTVMTTAEGLDILERRISAR